MFPVEVAPSRGNKIWIPTEKGSIEVGKLADLAVLSADLLTVPDDQIRDIEVLMTVMDGITDYQH